MGDVLNLNWMVNRCSGTKWKTILSDDYLSAYILKDILLYIIFILLKSNKIGWNNLCQKQII